MLATSAAGIFTINGAHWREGLDDGSGFTGVEEKELAVTANSWLHGDASYGPIANPSVTVVVPMYNEADCIGECVQSLLQQEFSPLEVLIVDDGSTDESVSVCEKLNVTVLTPEHLGPGAARNLGARHAKGNILVFADADMVLASDYVSKLTAPIASGEVVATCHWDELVLDWENPLARCETYYRGLSERRRQPIEPPAGEEVYRAVRKDFFFAAGGFAENAGRGDDSSVFRRTGVLAKIVREAGCYHRGASSWREVFREGIWSGRHVTVERQARWKRSLHALLLRNPVSSVWRIWPKVYATRESRLLLYAVVHSLGYDLGVINGLVTRNYRK